MAPTWRLSELGFNLSSSVLPSGPHWLGVVKEPSIHWGRQTHRKKWCELTSYASVLHRPRFLGPFCRFPRRGGRVCLGPGGDASPLGLGMEQAHRGGLCHLPTDWFPSLCVCVCFQPRFQAGVCCLKGSFLDQKVSFISSVIFLSWNTGNTKEQMFLDNPVWLYGKRKEKKTKSKWVFCWPCQT